MKLALGTVQFGLNYGINNKKGKILKKEVFEILTFAKENKIDMLDTAKVYGDSESIIGEFILKKEGHFKIISKTPFDLNNLEEDFKDSLKKLNQKKIYGYLVHDFKGYLNNKQAINYLNKLKEDGKIEKIGFSLYHPKELEYLLKNNVNFEIVQVPFNIFDQRFLKMFPLLKKKSIEIHVRSVFLQGLVFKDVNRLDNKFGKIKSKLEKLNKISKNINIPISQICISFAIENEYVDKVIVGVDSLKNLKDNFESLKNLKECRKIYNQLKELQEEDEDIILPMNWNK